MIRWIILAKDYFVRSEFRQWRALTGAKSLFFNEWLADFVVSPINLHAHMALLELRPMLQTEDYQGTLDFYTLTLGFECTSSIPELGWASLKLDNIALMISRPNSHTPFGGPKLTGSIYINTDDVEGWWARLKDVATVAYPIETMEYDMREFGILDNNGYLLQFGQAVEVPV